MPLSSPLFKMISLAGLVMGLALCILLVFHYQITPQDTLRLVRGFSPMWFAVLLLLSCLLMVVGAHKWRVMARAVGANGEQQYLRAYLWQNWVGQFVPPAAAIIVGRGIAERKELSFSSGVLSGFLDQGIELLFWFSFVPAALAWLLEGQRASLGLVFLLAFVCPVAAALVARVVILRFWPVFRDVVGSLVGLSLLRVVLTAVRLVVGVPTLSLALSWVAVAAAGPMVAMLAVIPLTPGNLGIAEWGWVGVLSWAKENPVDAGLLALGFRVLVLIAQTLLLAAGEFLWIAKKT
ncbi:MAG: hypothetical protein EOM37_01910 [Proteobacteria bacterium]|nr:hypothetical protein [Pseudomonadota bacterium]